MSIRIPAPAAIGVLLLVLVPFVKAGPPQRLKWSELSTVVGKDVSIAMPGGAVIGGKATSVEADALVVQIARTTDKSAYPKGSTRVPRAQLRVLEMRTKNKRYRILGTFLGAVAGAVGGVAAAIGIRGGILNNKNSGEAGAAFAGILAGATAAGYLIGNAADRKSTTIEIVPD